MKEQLISFETAKLAKEKGFDNIYVSYVYDKYKEIKRASITNKWIDEDPFALSYNYIAIAPTQSLLQKWLREEHKINLFIFFRKIKWGYCIKYNTYIGFFKTYEQALEKGLQEALTLIEENKIYGNTY